MNIITNFKDIHKGETCVLIGNGKSLDITPLKELSETYRTLGSNQIYRYPFFPDYLCIVDEEMLKACSPLPSMPDTIKFLRAESNEPDNNPIYPIVLNAFSADVSNYVVMGGTVSYALLQIAYYMGFTTVLLVGIDHHYPLAGKFTGRKIRAGSEDPDHFTCADGKPYFVQGKEYNAPEDTTISYSVANEVFRRDGRSIINLTPNSHLDVIERGKFKDWICM